MVKWFIGIRNILFGNIRGVKARPSSTDKLTTDNMWRIRLYHHGIGVKEM